MTEREVRPRASGRRVRRDAGPRDQFGVVRQPMPVIALRTVALLVVLGAIPAAFALRSDPPLPRDMVDAQHRLSVHLAADGLDLPVSATATPDEHLIFVAEKAGTIKVVSGLRGDRPRLVADLSERVSTFGDRGLIDLAVDPAYPTRPYLYALYTRDAPPGEDLPFWHGECPGSDNGKKGCVVTGELDRLELDANLAVVARTEVLTGSWCQIGLSHGVSELTFGPDGRLYIGAGDGASFDFADVGQDDGDYPAGPGRHGCAGDPPGEGGALRAQDGITADDPLGHAGSIIRFDPDAPDSTLEVIATGLRHPFGITFRPERDEMYIVDVGWKNWEEIDRISGLSTLREPVNFGWPCREGNAPTEDYANMPFCQKLTATHALTGPYFTQSRVEKLAGCANLPMTFTDAVFLDPAHWGKALGGSMVVSDWGSGCTVAFPLGNGVPDAATAHALIDNAGIVDLDVLHDGGLLLVGVGTAPGNGFVAVAEPG